jgi:hypothetical protein
MPQNTHLKIVTTEGERQRETFLSPHDPQAIHERAAELAHRFPWLPNTLASTVFAERAAAVRRALRPIFIRLERPAPVPPVGDDFRWLYDNGQLLRAELANVAGVLKQSRRIPHVRGADGIVLPRALAIAEDFLEFVGNEFIEQDFCLFVEVFQRTAVLELRELWLLPTMLKLVLLEQLAVSSQPLLEDPRDTSKGVVNSVRSLRELGQISWKDTLEPLIAMDRVLQQDPAGAYMAMDFDTRDLYRNKVSNIADHSDCSELEVAEAALSLARERTRVASGDARVDQRESHVGYYLVDGGRSALQEKVRFHAPFGQRLQQLLRAHPDSFFLLGIEMLALGLAAIALRWITNSDSSFPVLAFAMAIAFLPCSQSAIQLMNHWVTALLPPEILPKLDFSEGVPDSCITMVAVPCLLLNEIQVRGLVEDLEVRFLGNHDPNVHFALLTDLADSAEPAREDSPLINQCADLIQGLNDKYAGEGMGSFFMFHRHRVYNPRERMWMGWERKRGKLLDLNKLLRGQYDSFPLKRGELSILPRVRFVITLDADTELPRGSARRMIGTLAHPLNQAVIDPETNVVVEGYGILQPRVGVSVQSTTHSRLAAIFAGETGFDIYTRAVSDAYQELYGEGSFTGKGIYEVDTVHRVLDRRFPRNALLSHDLIEGAYARAGLASDIEVIEDYPSHYSAYNRRKHRWLRGDWQVAGWLLPHVPQESKDRTSNPISLVSWWKILDNLRRSLVEPAAFVFLVAGWLMPDDLPLHWTLTLLCILFLPAGFSFVLDSLKAAFHGNLADGQDALNSLFTASVNLLFTITFLAHQALLSLDAVVRALVRRLFTRRRLLEWETAAEAELGNRGRSPVDAYLSWTPVLAVSLGLLVWGLRRQALLTALPILILWACSGWVAAWLNRPPRPARSQLSNRNLGFLRRVALHTWRYFAEFSTAEHNWLIPDNVQEQPAAIAARVSPTNIGLLLNARQVACEFGYLTVPEFTEQTLQSLATLEKLETHRGHLLNWYDTRSLAPLAPRFVSSVDSGNLLASLWTLQQGCLDRLKQPVLQPCLAEGLLDYLCALREKRVVSNKTVTRYERVHDTDRWLQSVLDFPDEVTRDAQKRAGSSDREVRWLGDETEARVRNVRHTVRDYAPWLSHEFDTLRNDATLTLPWLTTVALQDLPAFMEDLIVRANLAKSTASPLQQSLWEQFETQLRRAFENVHRLIADLQVIATKAGTLADRMDFEFLLNKRRKLVSVGFDLETHRVHSACYDLLATESRTAVFCAIAKEDIPQESWFLLGRAHTLDRGRPVLLSWTGTLFEYLMPSLWMRSHPNTLLERSRVAAVRSQQSYAASKGVPWGISESAYSKLDEAGNYQYYAFGLSHLALRKQDHNALVISPYSTLLALDVDPKKALANLQAMDRMGWFGSRGFYEAADFSGRRRHFWHPRFQLVRCWMAHHQGMGLLALANCLNGNVVQKWFHAERRVQATELLLHEKPVAHVRRTDIPRSSAAA